MDVGRVEDALEKARDFASRAADVATRKEVYFAADSDWRLERRVEVMTLTEVSKAYCELAKALAETT